MTMNELENLSKDELIERLIVAERDKSVLQEKLTEVRQAIATLNESHGMVA